MTEGTRNDQEGLLKALWQELRACLQIAKKQEESRNRWIARLFVNLGSIMFMVSISVISVFVDVPALFAIIRNTMVGEPYAEVRARGVLRLESNTGILNDIVTNANNIIMIRDQTGPIDSPETTSNYRESVRQSVQQARVYRKLAVINILQTKHRDLDEVSKFQEIYSRRFEDVQKKLNGTDPREADSITLTDHDDLEKLRDALSQLSHVVTEHQKALNALVPAAGLLDNFDMEKVELLSVSVNDASIEFDRARTKIADFSYEFPSLATSLTRPGYDLLKQDQIKRRLDEARGYAEEVDRKLSEIRDASNEMRNINSLADSNGLTLEARELARQKRLELSPDNVLGLNPAEIGKRARAAVAKVVSLEQDIRDRNELREQTRISAAQARQTLKSCEQKLSSSMRDALRGVVRSKFATEIADLNRRLEDATNWAESQANDREPEWSPLMLMQKVEDLCQNMRGYSGRLADVADQKQFFELASASAPERRQQLMDSIRSVLIPRDGMALANERDQDGQTPMCVAASMNAVPEVVRMLMEFGAVSETMCDSANSAIHIAAREGAVQFIHELCRLQPAAADFANKDGLTPLMIAANQGKSEVIAVFYGLPRPANPLKTTTWGSTALHYAAQEGRVEAVEALLKHPDAHKLVQLKDAVGRRPIDIAKNDEVRSRLADASRP